jgi:hypothetical protein
MTLGHLALLLTLITLSFPNCAAEIFLAKPIGQRACEHLRDVTSTEMAVRRFQMWTNNKLGHKTIKLDTN